MKLNKLHGAEIGILVWPYGKSTTPNAQNPDSIFAGLIGFKLLSVLNVTRFFYVLNTTWVPGFTVSSHRLYTDMCPFKPEERIFYIFMNAPDIGMNYMYMYL